LEDKFEGNLSCAVLKLVLQNQPNSEKSIDKQAPRQTHSTKEPELLARASSSCAAAKPFINSVKTTPD
jgi:hypothetical protein